MIDGVIELPECRVDLPQSLELPSVHLLEKIQLLFVVDGFLLQPLFELLDPALENVSVSDHRYSCYRSQETGNPHRDLHL